MSNVAQEFYALVCRDLRSRRENGGKRVELECDVAAQEVISTELESIRKVDQKMSRNML